MTLPPDFLPRRLAVSAALGAAGVLAFAPLGWFPVVWLAFAGLYALLRRAADGRAARAGALVGGAFGLGGFLAGVSWVYVSLGVFGGMPAPVAAFATLLFCAAMALYPALAGALFAALAPSPGVLRALVFAAAWTLAEWLRGWLLTGFPWLAAGYSQTPPSPLAGFAPILGVHGVSFLAAFGGALIFEAVAGCRRASLAALGVLALASGLLAGREWTEARGEPLRVALLQGNIGQEIKWRPGWLEESLRAYYELMRDHPARLTVMPEAALPLFLDEVPAEYLDALEHLAVRQGGDLIFGVVTGNRARYANSAVALGASGAWRYDKSHLVPFGEFVPPGFGWFMSMASIPMSDFTPGEKAQPPFSAAGQKIAVNICYEDAFGGEIVRALPEATLLLNVSNMAWFGDSLAPAQHLQIARMRALETGRTILTATNTGLTAMIAPDGKVWAKLPPYTRAALTVDAQGHTGATPYTLCGNAPTVAVSILLLLIAGRRRSRLTTENTESTEKGKSD